MNKKIAICIPSYNESKNIANITKQIDDALFYLDNKYASVIFNSDNNSPDKTNEIFLNTKTHHPKESVVLDKRGKGYNIRAFFDFCVNSNIDYAITIDADLRSFNYTWLLNIVASLEKGNDFICPYYERRKEEGNTTNHFVVPILYTLYGKFIRQPIGGDYAFNLKYIKSILASDLDDDIMGYGIDIYMLIYALTHDFKVDIVYLGQKIHGVSYHKMANIFMGVAKGLKNAINKYPPLNASYEEIDYKPFIIPNQRWEYIAEVYDKLNFDPIKLDYDTIYHEWLDALNKYLLEDDFSHKMMSELVDLFMKRVVSFWQYIDDNDIENWETLIVQSCIDLRRLYEITSNKGI